MCDDVISHSASAGVTQDVPLHILDMAAFLRAEEGGKEGMCNSVLSSSVILSPFPLCSFFHRYALSSTATLSLPPLCPFLLCYALFSATLSRQMLADAASGCITTFRSVSLHFLTTRKQEVINFGVERWGGGGGGLEGGGWWGRAQSPLRARGG